MVSFAVDLVVVVGASRLLSAAFAVDFPLYLYTNFLFALLFFLPRIFFRCVLLLFYSRAIFGVKNAFNPFPTSPLAHFPSPTPFPL